MEQEITVKYGATEVRVDIEDVDVDLLVDCFDLAFRPATLVHHDAATGKKKVVPVAKRDKLVPGAVYHIAARGGSGGASPARSATPPTSSLAPAAAPKRSRRRANLWESDELLEAAQNAVVCCKAVYSETDLECEKYLTDNLANHHLGRVIRSRHGHCSFLIAEEESQGPGRASRVYIAFRGTRTAEDWKDNLRAYQVEGAASSSSGRVVQGKVHSGFLGRAALFPVDKILADETYQDRELVLCGHSLGGAIATVVAVVMMSEVDKRVRAGLGRERKITCLTFGAPLVGDPEMKSFCDERGFSARLFHLVSDGDPVPRLLSYAQCLSALSSQIDNQVRALISRFSNSREAAAFYEDKKKTWIEQKERYMDVLSRVIPAMEPILDAATIACPKYAGMIGTAKLGTTLVSDLVRSSTEATAGSKNKKVAYVNIGNYLFLTADSASPITLEYHEDERVLKCFEMSLEGYISETVKEVPVYHAVENYEGFVADWGNFAGCYNEFTTTVICVGGEPVENLIPRSVELADKYLPKITSAELVRVQSRSRDILRLRLTGYNLFNIVLDQCLFNFGFPFAGSEEKVIVKRMPLGTSVERVIFEEDYVEPPAISDHGTEVVLATQFGECRYLMNRGQFRNLVIPSVNQISHHDSISVLVKRAIQRGMAVAQVRRTLEQSGWKPANEKIVQEIIKLSSLTLEKTYFEEMCRTFEDTSKSVQFVLSNEAEFNKIQGYCDRIQAFLRKPLQIEAEKTIAKKIGIGAATLLGGATLAYLAGPGMVLVGVVEAASTAAAGVAGAVGSIGAGLVTHGLLSDRMVDENYEQVLKFVTLELFKKIQAAEGNQAALLQEVSDLREDGGTFSLEKALLLMYNAELGLDNFIGCDLENCTKESKLSVINRIECIRTVHSIRGILAKQCYIGVVGLQDAGKTTFLRSLWGVGGPTGHFEHTDAPSIHELDKRLTVVDFPGSNSLDYHARTFSICGAMNNLILVVIPYTGDISRLVSEELGRVFQVMAGSESSTQIVLCVNKCGYELPGAVRRELADVADPVDHLRARFASRLNENYESSGSGFSVGKERVFFTDWLAGEEARAVGIAGVEEVRGEIRRYLLDNHIYEPEEEELLKSVLSRDFPSRAQQKI